MSENGHVPIRMCIGCRKKRRKEEMIRLIKSLDGVALINEKKHLNGRGFYLCPNRICLEMARKKNRLGRITGMEGYGSLLSQAGLI